MLNWLKKGPVFGQKAEFWKFDICGNPVIPSLFLLFLMIADCCKTRISNLFKQLLHSQNP